jgi:hypothetical protein
MIDLPAQSLEVLVKIYIGQNIRNEGILQREVKEKDQTTMLLSKGLISENHWYLDQFTTSEKGSETASVIVRRRIEEKSEQLTAKVSEIPKRVLGFFVKRYVSKDLAFRASKPSLPYPLLSSLWEEYMLADSRIWSLRDKFFSALELCGLCVKTHYYVATRGGEPRGLNYVISPEIREFLVQHFSTPDFSQEEENTIRVYPVLKRLEFIISMNDLDSLRQQYYQLLKDSSVSEEQLAGVVDAANKVGVTSEYRGLLSERKPFEISEVSRFEAYLDQSLLQPAVNILLQEKGEIPTFPTGKRIQNFAEELGAFYLLVSSLERELRGFIVRTLGKRWDKRIEKDLPRVMQEWRRRKEEEEKLGIQPEKELVSYADLDHYIQIIGTYDRLFTPGGREELEDVKVKLKDWYRYGRNPIMHSRTVDALKIETTKSAINFLEAWMRRRTQPEP